MDQQNHLMDSGVIKYRDLYRKMRTMHQRILAGVGAETFRTQVFMRLEIPLCDENVFEVARSMGWKMEWLQISAKAKAKAGPNPVGGDVCEGRFYFGSIAGSVARFGGTSSAGCGSGPCLWPTSFTDVFATCY